MTFGTTLYNATGNNQYGRQFSLDINQSIFIQFTLVSAFWKRRFSIKNTIFQNGGNFQKISSASLFCLVNLLSLKMSKTQFFKMAAVSKKL
jgi:hypothetical protein